MKTSIPNKIESIQEAQDFLYSLWENGESFHPEDNAKEINWNLPKEQQPTENEAEKLNELMNQVYLLGDFDPCEYLLELDENK